MLQCGVSGGGGGAYDGSGSDGGGGDVVAAPVRSHVIIVFFCIVSGGRCGLDSVCEYIKKYDTYLIGAENFKALNIELILMPKFK